MSNLTSRAVDPRDTGWEVWSPAYRVHFWRRVSDSAWESREFEVVGDDVVAMVDWATRQARDGESFALFVVVDRPGDSGLVRLAGDDPTRRRPA